MRRRGANAPAQRTEQQGLREATCMQEARLASAPEHVAWRLERLTGARCQDARANANSGARTDRPGRGARSGPPAAWARSRSRAASRTTQSWRTSQSGGRGRLRPWKRGWAPWWRQTAESSTRLPSRGESHGCHPARGQRPQRAQSAAMCRGGSLLTVLQHQQVVLARELIDGVFALGRQAAAARVAPVGDRVQELLRATEPRSDRAAPAGISVRQRSRSTCGCCGGRFFCRPVVCSVCAPWAEAGPMATNPAPAPATRESGRHRRWRSLRMGAAAARRTPPGQRPDGECLDHCKACQSPAARQHHHAQCMRQPSGRSADSEPL